MIPTLSLLATCVIALLCVGSLALNSAGVAFPEPRRWSAHLAFTAVGLAGTAGLTLMPYRWWQRRVGCPDRWSERWRWLAEMRLPTLLLGLATVQLVLVLIPGLSVVTNGARRWPVWGGQPSELAKLVLILALADDLARHPLPAMAGLRRLLRPVGYAGAVAVLILVEPDWGGALVTLAVAGALLHLAGARSFHLVSAAIILGLLAVHGLLLDPHRLGRVLSFSDPEAYQLGAGYQQWRSLLAIGSGGWTGTSPGEGSFKGSYVPEQETDFIFSLLAEELGLVGVGAVLLLYVTLLGCGWRVAFRTRDPFGQYLVVGITLWITLQALIHVAVNTSSIPNKGLPLPFVSYGGSNLLCLLAGLGLVLSVGWHAPPAPGLDPAISASGEWKLLGRRLWRLVRGSPPSPVRHAYQLPPKAAAAPGRALGRWRPATQRA